MQKLLVSWRVRLSALIPCGHASWPVAADAIKPSPAFTAIQRRVLPTTGWL